jgi:hypothetical protein
VFKKLYYSLIDQDPGWQRLRVASQSLVAMLITAVCVMWFVSPLGLVFASVCAGFIPLHAVGERALSKLGSMLLFGVCMVAALALGRYVAPFDWVSNVVLVLLTLIGFSVGRFGPRFEFFPVITVVIYVLSMSLPVISATDTWHTVVAGGVGVVVSLVVWRAFPGNAHTEFRHDVESSFHLNAKACTAIMTGLEKAKPGAYFAGLIPQLRYLRMIVQHEQSIQGQYAATKPDKARRTQRFVILQYSAAKVLALINESLMQLARNHLILPDKMKVDVLSILEDYRTSFEGIQDYTHKIEFEKLDATLCDKLEALEVTVFSQFGKIQKGALYCSNLVFGLQRLHAMLDGMIDILQARADDQK